MTKSLAQFTDRSQKKGGPRVKQTPRGKAKATGQKKRTMPAPAMTTSRSEYMAPPAPAHSVRKESTKVVDPIIIDSDEEDKSSPTTAGAETVLTDVIGTLQIKEEKKQTMESTGDVTSTSLALAAQPAATSGSEAVDQETEVPQLDMECDSSDQRDATPPTPPVVVITPQLQKTFKTSWQPSPADEFDVDEPEGSASGE